jgi:hypothetical protein
MSKQQPALALAVVTLISTLVTTSPSRASTPPEEATPAETRDEPKDGNGFFLGLRAGYQRIAASATVGVATLGTITESATAESVFMNPWLGFLWTWANGFTIGLDAGVQLPVSASISTTLPEGIVQLDSSMTRVANALGHEPTPTIDLLRVGFLF